MKTKTGIMIVGGLWIKVKILRERTIFGRHEYEISPVDGRGTKWILASSFMPQIKSTRDGDHGSRVHIT